MLCQVSVGSSTIFHELHMATVDPNVLLMFSSHQTNTQNVTWPLSCKMEIDILFAYI